MLNSLVENTGVHLHSIIDRIGCKIHNVPAGDACYHLPNTLSEEAYYVGACGSRVKKAGFNGKISPQSMRSKAPAKSKQQTNQNSRKMTHTQRPFSGNAKRTSLATSK